MVEIISNEFDFRCRNYENVTRIQTHAYGDLYSIVVDLATNNLHKIMLTITWIKIIIKCLSRSHTEINALKYIISIFNDVVYK